jgi:hypothetical protein
MLHVTLKAVVYVASAGSTPATVTRLNISGRIDPPRTETRAAPGVVHWKGSIRMFG